MNKFVAERTLLFSEKGSTIKKKFSVQISKPLIIEKNMETSSIKAGYFYCQVNIQGLDEQPQKVYGVDSLQAVNLASNIEALIKRLQKKYDIFWLDEESYFDKD